MGISHTESAAMTLYSPNLIGIGIDRMSDNDYSGRIWHQYGGDETPFYSIKEMIYEMEALYDQWGFPQNSIHYRVFDEPASRTYRKPVRGEKNPDWMTGRQGELATFIAYVRYRQNATWQGELVWVEKQEKISFSSVLEFLRIMDMGMKKYQSGEILER